MNVSCTSWFTLSVLCLTLLLPGCQTAPAKDQTGPGDGTAQKPPEFSVTMECDPVHPRAIIARVHWPAEKAIVAAQRIEVTVNKNGFEKKRYISLTRMSATEQKSRQPLLPALDLRIVGIKHLKDKRHNEVVVSGLVPGVDYFWRLAPSPSGKAKSTVVRTRAPICPADMIDAREEKKQ